MKDYEDIFSHKLTKQRTMHNKSRFYFMLTLKTIFQNFFDALISTHCKSVHVATFLQNDYVAS